MCIEDLRYGHMARLACSVSGNALMRSLSAGKRDVAVDERCDYMFHWKWYDTAAPFGVGRDSERTDVIAAAVTLARLMPAYTAWRAGADRMRRLG